MPDSVYMVDLTCRTPPYDRCLCEGLRTTNVSVELWASGCHSRELRNANQIVQRGWSDVAVDLPVENATLIKGLKVIEYGINLLALLQQIWRNPPAVVHFQWLPLLELGPLEIHLIRLIRWMGIPVVYTVHDVLPLDDPKNAAAFERYRRVYREVDALICHTSTSKSRLQREFGVDGDKIWHIPHGPLQTKGTEDMDVSLSSVVQVNSSERVVVLFGVLRPYKGYGFLLQAWPEVVRELRNVRLVIAGRASSSVQSEIERMIEEGGVPSSVSTVYRYLSEAELSAVINAADILVYPYQNITQSGALFTGMEAGKPIVATDVGGLGETIRDRETGRLVSYGDENALAGVLVELLSSPKSRQRLGRAAKKDLQTRFSWKEIAQKTVECYRTAASNGKQKRV